ncbi:hypothetical protein PCANC_14941 [Puccinia coronata f. sp. avenae]|uniref:Secreted protein n=1 Tax=Puccinia coronata f. sp. avenae TaxID=200324 RepID=A0A2N5T2A6_9BASI|nr:hypothetical protein PCANC_14941 [Puccinia coronata f. sp. avenae]PLW51717.1 hypothetical protein PCASD_00561 [Puccinia coronata f. sp. avenae]
MNSRTFLEASLAMLIVCNLLASCGAVICPQAKCQSSSAFYARQLYTRCNAPILCKRHGNQQSKCGEDIQIEDAIRCPKCGVLSTPQGVELLICRKAPHRTKHCDPDMPSCRD